MRKCSVSIADSAKIQQLQRLYEAKAIVTYSEPWGYLGWICKCSSLLYGDEVAVLKLQLTPVFWV